MTDTILPDAAAPGTGGDRFGFGRNWQDFLKSLDDGRVERGEAYLRKMLELPDLSGKTFLDIGSGSGLFSLAARRMGAKVTSFDYDPDSVAATQSLQARYYPGDEGWRVFRGDVLDGAAMRGLGTFDIVYSWGVLHHTGQMYRAFAHAADAVKPGGLLYIAIYNDEGIYSSAWTAIKKLYNRLPEKLRPFYVGAVAGVLEAKSALGRLLRLRNPLPGWKRRGAESLRGMTVWNDYVDWVGGYPFEVARPDEIFHYFRARGFTMENMMTVGRGHGCNEFVFRRAP